MPWARGQGTTKDCCPLAHADNPVMRSSFVFGSRHRVTTIGVVNSFVKYVDGHRTILKVDVHCGWGSSGVLRDVRERLLDDAIYGEIQARWEFHSFTTLLELDLDTRRSKLHQQLINVVDARGRSQARGVGVIAPQDTQYSPELFKGRAAGHLHRSQGLTSFFGLHVKHVATDARLDRYDAEAMGDNVVQLPSDLKALFSNGLLGSFDLSTLALLGLSCESGNVRTPGAHTVADEPGRPGHDDIGCVVSVRRMHDGGNPERRQEHTLDDAQSDDGGPTFVVSGHDVESEGYDGHSGEILSKHKYSCKGAGDHNEHGNRVSPTEGEGKRGDTQCRCEQNDVKGMRLGVITNEQGCEAPREEQRR